MAISFREVEGYAKGLNFDKIRQCHEGGFSFAQTPKGSESLINIVLDCATEDLEVADQIVLFLIEQGAPFEKVSALCKAVGQDLVASAGQLLELASPEELLSTLLGQPLLFFVDSIRMLNLLVSSAKVELRAVNQFGDTLLHYLVENLNFNEPLFDVLIRQLGVNATNNLGRTPIMNLCFSYFSDPEESFRIFDKLYSSGADLDQVDAEGCSFRDYATDLKNTSNEILKKLEDIPLRKSKSLGKKLRKRNIFF